VKTSLKATLNIQPLLRRPHPKQHKGCSCFTVDLITHNFEFEPVSWERLSLGHRAPTALLSSHSW